VEGYGMFWNMDSGQDEIGLECSRNISVKESRIQEVCKKIIKNTNWGGGLEIQT
jgi:hypothetical protein